MKLAILLSTSVLCLLALVRCGEHLDRQKPSDRGTTGFPRTFVPTQTNKTTFTSYGLFHRAFSQAGEAECIDYLLLAPGKATAISECEWKERTYRAEVTVATVESGKFTTVTRSGSAKKSIYNNVQARAEIVAGTTFELLTEGNLQTKDRSGKKTTLRRYPVK